jgi:SAM-dependent methyltransferase
MAGLMLYCAIHPPTVRLSQYKGLSYALNLPGARLLATRSSAIGRVDVVSSPSIRQAPGLSLVTPPEAAIPPQLGLFVDAEAAGAVTAFDGDMGKLGYVDWMNTAAYQFTRPDSPRVCVLGAGGGAGVLLALRHGAQQVDAVELDANVVRLLRETFRDFSGALYSRPDVDVHLAEGRAFLEATPTRWDVIDISLVDSFAAAAVGLGAVNESYLYTQEAFETYLRHLRPGGLLTVTRWVRMPPRDELKLFATAIAALENMNLHPAERLVLVRSWATATLLVKREPFAATELTALRRWAEERLFDTAYFPGMAAGDGNRFNILAHDWYAEAAGALLAPGASRDRFFSEYPFFLQPATDDRPYFFHFFRWQALPMMLSSAGKAWIPFVEWGYLILVATLIQAALLSSLFLILPLALLRRGAPVLPRSERDARLLVLIYFLALGIGYMFVEMALIQRLVFFLANPIYAVAVVLAGLLLVSGLGSGWVVRLLRRGYSARSLASRAALAVAVTAIVYAFGLRAALMPLLSWPLSVRMAMVFVVMLPLGAMGMLFPLGLRHLGRAHAELLPWAWAINGCASVVATSLATLLALGAGLVVVLVAAAVCYLAAALVARKWVPAPQT